MLHCKTPTYPFGKLVGELLFIDGNGSCWGEAKAALRPPIILWPVNVRGRGILLACMCVRDGS